MITLHQFAISPFSDKIQRLIKLKGLEYRVKEYPLMDKGVKLISPTGKLPCLEHYGKFIVDSTDIAYFLEQEYPQVPVIPTAPAEQAMVHILEDWADESLYFYEMHMRFGVPENGVNNFPKMLANNKGFSRWFLLKVLPKGVSSVTKNQGVGRKSVEQLTVEIKRHFEAVDKLLSGGDWLVGSQITLADLSVFAMFFCLRDAPQAAALLENYPRINDWMERIHELTDQPVPDAR